MDHCKLRPESRGSRFKSRMRNRKIVMGPFICLKLLVLIPYVFCSVMAPGDIIKNVGEDVVFMWNTSNATRISSASWGLLSSDDSSLVPSLISISARNSGLVLNVDTSDVRYKGRISWVGDLSVGHAWFKITNLTLQDTNKYASAIREIGQDKKPLYPTLLTVAAIPSFPHFPTSPYPVQVIEGRDLVINCKAIGPPTPTVQWFTSDGTVITSASVTGTVTLTKTNVQRSHSGAKYKCVASNNPNSDPVSTMIKVVVLYPPNTIVTPPSVTIVQYNMITLSCTADGNPPPSISWTKAVGVIKAGHTVAGGTLRIPDAIKTDAGNYVCTANNTYDSREHIDSATATVTVKYQPSIFLEMLLNQTVNVTESLSIKCGAEGNPPPTLKWKTPTGSDHPGSVYNISSVKKSDAGTYTCTANNNIGREATASLQVVVQYPSSIDVLKSSLTFKSWDGYSIHLSCFATGLPTPKISWYKPTGQQITTGVNIVPGGSVVTVLTTADHGDYGQYKCRATNILESDEHVINVTQLFSPNCSSFAMTEGDIEASSITVRWNKPDYDGGSSVTGYKVKINTSLLQEKNTSDTNVKFTGLTKNTKYKVEVFARNIAGYGRPCIKIITTKKLGKPAVPELTVTVGAVQSDKLSVKLTWTKPDNNGKEISKYTIYMKEDTEVEFAKIDDVLDPAVLEYQVTKNMEHGKTYKFVVTASNELGESEYDDTMVKSITMPKKENPSNKDKRTSDNGGSNTAVITGAVGAVLFMLLVALILGVIIIRKKGLLSKGFRRKSSSNRAAYDNDIDLDSAANQQAAGSDETPTYAAVDMSKKKKKPVQEDIPNYAAVDKSKKKHPGEIIYAELADFNTAGTEAAAAAPRPITYTGTDYADIAQFQKQDEPEPTYANFPGRGKTYTNIQGM